MMRFLGIDVGTSAVKAAVFGDDGKLVAGVAEPMPELEWDTDEQGVSVVTQDPAAILRAVAEAVGAVTPYRAGFDLVALTTQRDTFLLVDRQKRPASPLLSWLDGRSDGGGAPLEPLLHGWPRRPEGLAARSLTSWLSALWTGRPGETTATLPRFLQEGATARLVERLGAEALPEVIRVGGEIGLIEPVASSQEVRSPVDPMAAASRPLVELLDSFPLHLTAGDKNCEMLGAGVLEPGIAGLSLGSAISLGTLAPGDPGPLPLPIRGVVRTPAALPGRWNLETGMPLGFSGLSTLTEWLSELGREHLDTGRAAFLRAGRDDGVDPPLLVPRVGPGLDGAFPGPQLEWHSEPGGTSDPMTTDLSEADLLLRGWMWGVAAELLRLRPRLERAARTSLREIRLYGGGAAIEGWATLLSAAFDLPVVSASDGFTGSRGAIASALFGRRSPALSAGYRDEIVSRLVRSGEGIRWVPESRLRERFSAWYHRWTELSRD